MKNRIFIFTVLLLLLAVNSFAQLADGISFNAWGRGAFAPLIVFRDAIDPSGDSLPDYQNGAVFVGTGSTRPNFGYEFELYIKGDYDNIGFQLGLSYDGETVGGSVTQEMYWYNSLGAAIWVKPLGNELLKITAGRFNDDTLRGKIGEVNDGWEEFVVPGAGFKDEIFTRFGEHYYKNLGFMLSSTPIDGLYIGVRANAPGLWGTAAQLNRADDVYRYIQIGAGYAIPGIGHARLQYLGGYLGNLRFRRLQKYIDDTNKDYSGVGDPFTVIPPELNPNGWHGTPARMEAAFALTMIDNLLVDLGFKAYFPIVTEGALQFPSADYQFPYIKSSKGFALGLGATYTIADFSVTGRLDSAFGGYYRTNKDDKNYYDPGSPKLTFDMRLVPVYDLGFAQVGLDFGLQTTGNEIDTDGKPKEPSYATSKWGIGGFIKKTFSKGYIKGGISYTSPIIYANEGQKARIADKMIQIPVIMEFDF